MKRSLIVLFALSVAFNLAFALLYLLQPPARSGGSTVAAGTADSPTGDISAAQGGTREATAAATGSRASAGRAAVTWNSAGGGGDLRSLVAGLRGAGFPAPVIRAVVNQLISERFADRQPDANLPYWKRVNPSPEMVTARLALESERRELFESLLGEDARPSAMIPPGERERRFGSLSDEKIDAIAKIERDYNEISAEAWAKRRGNVAVSSDSIRETQQMMEAEKLADLAAVLTPDELAQYELRTSPVARSVMNNVRNIDVTEAEFASLYQLQKDFNAANPMVSNMDGATYAQRQAAQIALHEQARGLLGDERFYAYVEGADYQYANIARTLGKFAGVTPAATYQVYRLQYDLQAQLTQAGRGGRLSPEATNQLRATVEDYNRRLDTLLGPEAANAYRQSPQAGAFRSFRNAPRPAVPSG